MGRLLHNFVHFKVEVHAHVYFQTRALRDHAFSEYLFHMHWHA